jgi:MFS family permease
MSGSPAGAGEFEVASPPLATSALWGLLLPAALVPLSSTTVAVALPAIGREFGQDPAGLTQWLVNSYLAAAIVLQAPAGKLADRWGVHRALLAGQGLFAFGALLGALGGSLPPLVAARVLMAAGGAFLMTATMAVLRDSTAPQRRARVFGVFGATMGLAAAVGPLLGGLLVDSLGWRAIFLANVPALAYGAVLVRGLVRTSGGERAVAFDWLGSAVLALALALAVTGLTATGVLSAAALPLAGAALMVFIRLERRAPDPVIDLTLFRRPPFAAGGSILALHNWVMYALIFQLPLRFDATGAHSSSEIGRALIALMLGIVACSPLGGRAAERIGTRAPVMLGSLTALAGLLLLTRTGPLATPAGAVTPLLLIGVGLGLASAPVQAAAVSVVSRAQSGMAAGALSTMRYVGGIAGIGALGAILRRTAQAEPALVLRAHQSAIWLSCGVMVVALLAAARLPGRAAQHGAERAVLPGEGPGITNRDGAGRAGRRLPPLGRRHGTALTRPAGRSDIGCAMP